MGKKIKSARHIYLVGVSCVGKSAIGAMLAENLGMRLIEFDKLVKEAFGKPIGRVKQPYLSEYSFRVGMAPIFKKRILELADQDFVMELPPSGLMGAYWRLLKKQERAIIVSVHDKPENIRDRSTSYDDDGVQVYPKLSEKHFKMLLSEIKKGITYFGRTHRRAHLHVDLDGAGIEDGAKMVQKAIAEYTRVR